MTATVAFALASALHAGFQATVTVLVYPALTSRGPDGWATVHARHARAITPLVGVVYVALGATGAWLLLSGPGALGWLALAGATASVATTAALAAPLHGRLAEHDQTRLARLLVVDRWRCAGAVLGALAAVAAVSAG